MEGQIATVDTNGHLALPAAISEALGIQPGSQMEVTIEGSHIVLQPVSVRPMEQLRGMFAGQPPLEDDLIEWRRQEKENEKW